MSDRTKALLTLLGLTTLASGLTAALAMNAQAPAHVASVARTSIAAVIIVPPGGSGEPIPVTVSLTSGGVGLGSQQVQVTIYDPSGALQGSGTLTTTSTGTVSGSVSIPALPNTTYTIKATYNGSVVGSTQYTASSGSTNFSTGGQVGTTTTVTLTG